MPGLTIQTQRDFAAGSFQNPARELIPENGFASAINGLLDEDGTIYRRGGSTYKSSSDFAAALTFIWDGFLSAGARTLFASAASFGVLDADDATVITLGGSGTDGQRPAAGNYLLFIPLGASGTAGQIAVYGGSRKTAVYSTGTLTTTAGSKTVTGAGTTFTGNVDAGMILVSGGVVLGTVFSVDSNTQITLRDAAYSVVTTVAYSANPVYVFAPLGAVAIAAVATVSNPARLVVATGSDMHFSPPGNPFTFAATDFHRLPQGATTIGMESLRNVLFSYTTAGIFTVTGMDFDLVDAAGNVQQRLEQINRDVVLWDARGIAGWHGALVVPATDDVYLVTDSAAPQALSGPIRKRYRDYVRQGFQTGFGATYRNHFFLPIVNGNTWVDTLVLRLDQGGWLFWDGHGGTSFGFASRASTPTRTPLILSAGGRRVLDMTQAFNPTGATKNDADATTHVFTVITRDYTTDELRKALVKKLRLRYELNDAANDDPTLTLGYSTGQTATNPLWGAVTWGAFKWGASTVEQFADVPGSAPEGDGTVPYVWPILPTQTGVRPRFARFRIRSVGPSARLTIRALEIFTRSGGRQ